VRCHTLASAWALTYKIVQVARKPACFDNLPRDHEAGGSPAARHSTKSTCRRHRRPLERRPARDAIRRRMQRSSHRAAATARHQLRCDGWWSLSQAAKQMRAVLQRLLSRRSSGTCLNPSCSSVSEALLAARRRATPTPWPPRNAGCCRGKCLRCPECGSLKAKPRSCCWLMCRARSNLKKRPLWPCPCPKRRGFKVST
jgi:hypothetical protein